LLVLVALSSCAPAGPDWDDAQGAYDPDDGEATVDEYTERVDFNKNRVLEDIELTHWSSMQVSDVQAFLEATPYGWSSVLANHTSNGKTAAQAMVAAAETYEINPLVILTRIQLEQSLVGKQTATNKALDYAMGCGCPDNQACNPAYKGFDRQIDCMASRFRSYLDDLAGSGTTVSGWGVGKTKTTLDGIGVTPETAATASVYTYTPWVASAKNHVKIWALYTSYVGYQPPGDQPDPDPDPDPDPGTLVDVVVDSDNALDGKQQHSRLLRQRVFVAHDGGELGSCGVRGVPGRATDRRRRGLVDGRHEPFIERPLRDLRRQRRPSRHHLRRSTARGRRVDAVGQLRFQPGVEQDQPVAVGCSRLRGHR
jgi:hypothetical protein